MSPKPDEVVLDIQNVTQKLDVDSPELKKSFGQRLRESATEYKQEKLPNGDIKITLVIPAKKPEDKKNG